MYRVLLSGQSVLMQSFNVTAIRGRHLSFTGCAALRWPSA